jgi:long-chain acyl-CoA synthetase
MRTLRRGSLDPVRTLMHEKLAAYRRRPALSQRNDGSWTVLSFAHLALRAERLAQYLLERGLGHGDRIAILGEPSPEWAIALFAAFSAGAIVVPLDTKLGADELDAILADADPRALFYSARCASLAQELVERRPAWRVLLPLPSAEHAPALRTRSRHQPPRLAEGDTATLVYIPGDDGMPKGVMTTFGNLIFELRAVAERTETQPGEVFLSNLPLNHLLELTCGLLGVLHAGAEVCFAGTIHPPELMELIREKPAQQMITVPLVLRLLKGYIERQVRRMGETEQRSFAVRQRVARWLPRGRSRRRLFAPVLRALGWPLPGFRHFISGAAKLDVELADFFENLGLPVLDGYGLTETSPVVAMNTPRRWRRGSVGQPMPGVRVHLAKDKPGSDVGEILTAGPHVMKGYYKKESLTSAFVDAEGWLHTGDLGRIDGDGFVFIVGRSKELIVLGGGKKVRPEEVEAVLGRVPYVKEACVIGLPAAHSGEEICAVVVPAAGALDVYRGDRARLEEVIRAEIRMAARPLAPFKRPGRVVVRYDELPRTAAGRPDRASLRSELRAPVDEAVPTFITETIHSGGNDVGR